MTHREPLQQRQIRVQSSKLPILRPGPAVVERAVGRSEAHGDQTQAGGSSGLADGTRARCSELKVASGSDVLSWVTAGGRGASVSRDKNGGMRGLSNVLRALCAPRCIAETMRTLRVHLCCHCVTAIGESVGSLADGRIVVSHRGGLSPSPSSREMTWSNGGCWSGRVEQTSGRMDPPRGSERYCTSVESLRHSKLSAAALHERIWLAPCRLSIRTTPASYVLSPGCPT
ncbi:hypothetical protein FKP32DRAFT_690504 [Trametes sanguinea]|nr:hypothetical protein FKP32DRAFT_690504 [Trametes sanguinea]